MKAGGVIGVLGFVFAVVVFGGVGHASITITIDSHQSFSINDWGPDNCKFSDKGPTWSVCIEDNKQTITETCKDDKKACDFDFRDGDSWQISCDKNGQALCKCTHHDTVTTPEPSALVIWALLGGLAAGLAWWRGRKAA